MFPPKSGAFHEQCRRDFFTHHDITFMIEGNSGRAFGILGFEILPPSAYIARAFFTMFRRQGKMDQMKQAGEAMMKAYLAESGQVVHVNMTLRSRRTLLTRTLMPKKTIRFVDGSTTPPLVRPLKPLKHRIRVARRYLGFK